MTSRASWFAVLALSASLAACEPAGQSTQTPEPAQAPSHGS